jgi:hypothetical protein
MPEVPATPPSGREPGPPRLLAPGLAPAWGREQPQPIEIVAPDSHCIALLLSAAEPHFPAEVVYESSWIVRLEPPAGGEWVLELLSLVEGWLEACRLPCAKVFYEGRGYLIRASADGAWFKGAAESSHDFPEFSLPG